MRVYTSDNRIVQLKHFRFSHAHFLILMQMQSDQTLCNCLLEIEGNERKFIPVHKLSLDDFKIISHLNLPTQ